MRNVVFCTPCVMEYLNEINGMCVVMYLYALCKGTIVNDTDGICVMMCLYGLCNKKINWD